MLSARSALSGLIDLAPISALQTMVPRDVVAIFYHTLSDAPLPHVSPLYACKSAKDFEQDLLYLKDHFRLVSHEEIAAARAGGRRLPPRAAALSFDDGFAQCFSIARPLLLKHGVPCTFFVITQMVGNRALMHRNKVALCLARLDARGGDESADLAAVAKHCGQRLPTRRKLRRWAATLGYGDGAVIDQLCTALGVDVDAYMRTSRPYMTADEIRALHDDAFTIGAHSLDHPALGQLPWDLARAQIVESCEYVRSLTGRSRVPFAFPFNGVDLPRRRLAQLRAETGSIDLMYDTNNLMKDEAFIVNRVWCDSPSGTSKRSNLAGILRRAHAYEPLRAAKRWLAGGPN